MKKLFLFFFMLGTFLSFSQVPSTFSYRSVVFEKDTIPLKHQNIRVDVYIQDMDTEDAKVLYAESHFVETNDRGGYSLQIGGGNAQKDFTDMTDVLWIEEGDKFVNIQVYDEDGNLLSSGISQLMSVPYALVAKEVVGDKNKNKNQAVEVDNLDALRQTDTLDGKLVYVKGHTEIRDGGEGFFYYDSDFKYSRNGGDDKGIIIKPNVVTGVNQEGRWLRSFDGPINVNYYGITSGSNPDPTITSVSDRIQIIIDYAHDNQRGDESGKFGRTEGTKGNTIYFPNGGYTLDKPLILKSGITIMGEGNNTIFHAEGGANYDYMFKSDQVNGGRIVIQLEKFVINGRYCDPAIDGTGCQNPSMEGVGGMYFKAVADSTGTGGLQRSKLKNIQFVNMGGHGLHLEGGGNSGNSNNTSLPTQYNVFENIWIGRKLSDYQCILLEGQQSENIFIRCAVEGNRKKTLTGPDVLINNVDSNNNASQSNGNMFLNCGFGHSEIGVHIRDSEGITFDACWFEKTFTAINLKDAKKISITNTRFANAGGFGSEVPKDYSPPSGISGECIKSENSSVIVEGSYTLVSSIGDIDSETRFIRGVADSSGVHNNAIISRNNGF